MATIRFHALKEVLSRKPVEFKNPYSKSSDYYSSNVFNLKIMREYMTPDAYKVVVAAIETGKKIDRNMADSIAASMKAWASSRGVTH
jgi:glutamine synthetase